MSSALRRIGVVVHPSRDIGAPLGELRDWCERHAVALGQVTVSGQRRQVAPAVAADACDVVVSVGGDGTMLAGIRAAMGAGVPALGVASGSLGVLTRVAQGEVAAALDRVAAGDWVGRELPVLVARAPGGAERLALNDIAVVRAGIGQIRVTAHADGVLFTRIAGDGAIVCTPLGSSAYSLAAGGPLLGLDAHGFVLTPLPTHGGTTPPLVLGAGNRLELEIGQGFGGARLEVDGQIVDEVPERLQVGLRTGAARLVAFADQEPLLSVLRSRGILVDSPRILAEDLRLGRGPAD